MTDTLTHFINGEAVAADTPGSSLNPSNTNDVVAALSRRAARPRSTPRSKAARAAFPAWSDASPEVRSDLLDKVGATIMARAKELGELLSREEGKTVPEGMGEVMRAARIFKYFAGEALRRHGQTLEFDPPRHRRLDLSRSGRRVRPDHAVEFPDRDPGLEDRAGAGLRQYGGAEARQPDAGHRPRARRDHPRMRRAARACSTS